MISRGTNFSLPHARARARSLSLFGSIDERKKFRLDAIFCSTRIHTLWQLLLKATRRTREGKKERKQEEEKRAEKERTNRETRATGRHMMVVVVCTLALYTSGIMRMHTSYSRERWHQCGRSTEHRHAGSACSFARRKSTRKRERERTGLWIIFYLTIRERRRRTEKD